MDSQVKGATQSEGCLQVEDGPIKISVIVPVYNVKEYLQECLDSIIKQTYSNLELILVDDGSTDGSESICDDYAGQDSRIKVYHQTNSGQAAARNFGIEQSSGDYLVFVDSDDVVSSTYLEELYHLIDGQSNHIGITALTRRREQLGDEAGASKTVLSKEDGLKWVLYHRSNEPVGKIYPRLLFDAIKFPVGEIYEDMAIAPFLTAQASGIVHKPIKTYYYRKRPGSTMTTVITARSLVIKKQLQRIHHMIRNNFPEQELTMTFFAAGQLLSLAAESQDKALVQSFWEEYLVYKRRFLQLAKTEKKSLGFYANYARIYLSFMPRELLFSLFKGAKAIKGLRQN